MKDMIMAQKDRVRFLHALLDYASKSGSSDPYIYSKDFAEKLGIDQGQFNVLQNSLGNKYCVFVDYVDNKKRYKIYTGECWHLYDEFEQAVIHKENALREKYLLRLTVALLVVTFLAVVVALPPALEVISKYTSFCHIKENTQTNTNNNKTTNDNKNRTELLKK